MEKLDKPLTKNYGPLVMWASDLAELLSELKDCNNIEFVADDVKFDTVDEFVRESRGHSPSEVKIGASNPYLSVTLDRITAKLYVSSSQLLASGLFLRIDSILSRCERKPKFIYGIWWVWFSSSLVWIIFLPPLKPYSYLVVWFFGLYIPWLIYIAFLNIWRFSVIQPMHREERPSFIRRNLDGIVIAIISALLGAIGGVVATKMADRIWPNTLNAAIEKDTTQAAKLSGSPPASGIPASH